MKGRWFERLFPSSSLFNLDNSQFPNWAFPLRVLVTYTQLPLHLVSLIRYNGTQGGHVQH